MSSPRHLAAVTSACARPPSTPGPTRFKEISLQNRRWVYELRLQRRAAAARRFGAALPAEGLRLRGAQENPRLARGLERAGLVAARADGPHRAAVLARLRRLRLADRADVKMNPSRTMDNMVAADLIFSRDRAEPMPGADQAIEETVDFATALVCAEAVGAMKFACDTTLEYLKTRKQFGVPIGTFQALQHRMVDMVISYEQARSMACLACSRVDQAANAAERSRSVSAAKIKIADSARHIGQEAVQLHGGMGMSEELKLSHSFRRLTVAAQQFGDADHHLARFASL